MVRVSISANSANFERAKATLHAHVYMPATDVWFEQYSKRFCVSVYSEVIFTYLIVCRVYNIIITSFTSI